jgi:hypothetical protein
MNDLRNEPSKSQSLPGSRRRQWCIALMRGVAMGAALGVLLHLANGMLSQAFQGETMRAWSTAPPGPWLIAVQLVLLGLLWRYWDGFVPWFCRLFRFPQRAEAAVLRDKRRVFGGMAGLQLLIALQGLAGLSAPLGFSKDGQPGGAATALRPDLGFFATVCNWAVANIVFLIGCVILLGLLRVIVLAIRRGLRADLFEPEEAWLARKRVVEFCAAAFVVLATLLPAPSTTLDRASRAGATGNASMPLGLTLASLSQGLSAGPQAGKDRNAASSHSMTALNSNKASGRVLEKEKVSQ